MSEERIIVEVSVENGLPGAEWAVERDPRLLLAVVFKLQEFQKHNSGYQAREMVGSDKFTAVWKDGNVELFIPLVDGDHRVFLFILEQTILAMAKVLIEIEWGSRIMAELQEKVARARMLNKGIAVPGGGQIVL